jgi:DNA-directed RNA polymerase specialized sigma subunit
MSQTAEDYKNLEPGSEQLISKLVEDNMGWAQAIARTVARAWKLDWQLDGLDGGAYEGLLFCARRYDPARGVPFRAYARRRIHESSTDEARKSKSWKQGVGVDSPEEQTSREVSSKLFQIFPDLRAGLLPAADDNTEETMRKSIRHLLTSSALLVSLSKSSSDNPEMNMQFKQMLSAIGELEVVHQQILWGIYWQGQSMRGIASEWKINELAVIREHQDILTFVFSRLSENKKKNAPQKLKIRPALRVVAQKMRKENVDKPFSQFVVFLLALKLGEVFFKNWL